ncbi:M20 metallopeptidase family protein [Streptacidiphilus jiangxiensis]|uniref:Hippurate hydrolase n=1 Tax=Streptacidiphilus jiangxiensis TaxID=235985 RepID=A0A1H7T287_STRJI|nr:M20 family metallopeptidase [Streptacidiphilus jiangxiensis]SEL79052.1 hippurate hydrolase [Streptacidiphilus jiangxiensis]
MSAPVLSVRDHARTLAPELTALRRELHAEPELGRHLPLTQQRVLDALAGMPLEITTGSALSSVTAVLRGARPGPTVLLRADMDALPLTEDSGLPYASRVPGVMHACGHDLHTAMLVGAARLLAERRADLAGSVVFMFQPDEEGTDGGGAVPMLAEGLLHASGEKPAAAYALHVASNRLPFGVFASRPGTAAAASDGLTVTVRGKGGHGSAPHKAADPIPALCEMVTALQTFVTRSFDIHDPVVLGVGVIRGGTKRNVIPDHAGFEATVRTYSTAARDRMREGTRRLLTGIAAAHGLTAEVDYQDGYPALVNDPAETALAARTVTDLFGPRRYLDASAPTPGAEDMAFVLDEVPGTYLMLGACPPGGDFATAPYNHSPQAVFDDSVLPDGAALLTELTLRRLALALALAPADGDRTTVG